MLSEYNVAIAPRTYDAHKTRAPSTRAVRDARVLAEVTRVHTDPQVGRGPYGVGKVHAQLVREGGVEGAPVSRRQVERLAGALASIGTVGDSYDCEDGQFWAAA